MSYNNPRITLDDDTMSCVLKLSEGNPGATTVLVRLLREGEQIDPDSAFGGLGGLLSLDTLDVYGSRIWILYKDICGEDLTNMLGLMCAVQLGLLPESELTAVIDHGRPRTDTWVADNVALVRDRLPAFGRT